MNNARVRSIVLASQTAGLLVFIFAVLRNHGDGSSIYEILLMGILGLFVACSSIFLYSAIWRISLPEADKVFVLLLEPRKKRKDWFKILTFQVLFLTCFALYFVFDHLALARPATEPLLYGLIGGFAACTAGQIFPGAWQKQPPSEATAASL